MVYRSHQCLSLSEWRHISTRTIKHQPVWTLDMSNKRIYSIFKTNQIPDKIPTFLNIFFKDGDFVSYVVYTRLLYNLCPMVLFKNCTAVGRRNGRNVVVLRCLSKKLFFLVHPNNQLPFHLYPIYHSIFLTR